MRTITLAGSLALADKARSDYFYVPFEVPPHIGKIVVRYSYNHTRDAADLVGHGNTIDIGIFDSRGSRDDLAVSMNGFRGWSGSDRNEFFIAEREATPGYLAGAIQQGVWHIVLGLYHIADAGCDWHIAIDLLERNAYAPLAEPIRMELPPQRIRSDAGWYRGDLQCHSHHSDGKGSLGTLIQTAQIRGLDFLAVTDHNTVSHIIESAQRIRDGHRSPVLIPATEVTTYYGHMNVWGIRAPQDFRCSHADARAMQHIIESAHTQGALCSINHPKTDGPRWEYGTQDVDCIEAWQAFWQFYNEESLAFWDAFLLQGKRVIAVGGSDYHQPLAPMQPNPHLLGHPTTWVFADALSADDILAGIRRGRVCISADVNGARVDLHVRDGARWLMMGETLTTESSQLDECELQVTNARGCEARLIADGVCVRQQAIDRENEIVSWRGVLRPRRFLRAEIIMRNAMLKHWVMLALSNPIFVS